MDGVYLDFHILVSLGDPESLQAQTPETCRLLRCRQLE